MSAMDLYMEDADLDVGNHQQTEEGVERRHVIKGGGKIKINTDGYKVVLIEARGDKNVRVATKRRHVKYLGEILEVILLPTDAPVGEEDDDDDEDADVVE